MKNIFLLLICICCVFPRFEAQSEDVDFKITLALENLAQTEKRFINKAKKSLLKLGKPVLPRLKRQLEILSALIQKLEGTKPKTPNYTKAKNVDLEEYFQAKYIQAEKYFRAKKYSKAIEFIDAILLIEPKNSLESNFLKLRAKCKEKQFRKEILTATLQTKKTYHETGNTIPLKYTLKNRTDSNITIPRKFVKETDEWFGSDEEIYTKALLQIKFTYKDSFGNTSTKTAQYDKEIPQDIKLAKGEQFTLNFPFNPNHNDFLPQQFIYREFEVTLILHPSQLLVSAQPSFKSYIRSTPVVFIVLPKGLLQFKEDPLSIVKRTYQSKKLEKLFFATLLFHQKDKANGVDFLIRCLPQSNFEERRILTVCLKELTNQNFAFDIDQWKYWWKAKKEFFK